MLSVPLPLQDEPPGQTHLRQSSNRAKSFGRREDAGWPGSRPAATRQVPDQFADAEVASVVDGGFRAQRPAFLVILLDPCGFVIDVQRRHDAIGNDASPKTTGCLF